MGVQPEGVEGASGKPPPRLRRGETLCDKKNQVTKMHAAKEAFALED